VKILSVPFCLALLRLVAIRHIACYAIARNRMKIFLCRAPAAMNKEGGRYDALDISDYTIKHLRHFFRIAVRSGIESTGFESTLFQKKTY
jgi:hypothetical protein